MRTIQVLLPIGMAISIGQPVQPTAAQTGEPLVGAKDETITLQVRTDPAYGRYLTDSDGRAVYMFTKDEKGKSNCGRSCSEAWPPVHTAAEPRAGDGVAQNKIGTIEGDGKKRQVTYDGRPLYYYKVDGNTTAAAGQRVFSYDGDWYLLAPDGAPIKAQRKEATPPPGRPRG